MARFYGKVGYGIDEESTTPGVWTPSIVERNYYGDVLRQSHRWEQGESLNDNLKLSNRISIVADAFAYEHAYAIRYITWMGTQWKVTELEIQRPRIILTIGGVYNGDQTGTP